MTLICARNAQGEHLKGGIINEGNRKYVFIVAGALMKKDCM